MKDFEFIKSETQDGMTLEVITTKADLPKYGVAMKVLLPITDEDWERLESGNTIVKNIQDVSVFIRVKVRG